MKVTRERLVSKIKQTNKKKQIKSAAARTNGSRTLALGPLLLLLLLVSSGGLGRLRGLRDLCLWREAKRGRGEAMQGSGDQKSSR